MEITWNVAKRRRRRFSGGGSGSIGTLAAPVLTWTSNDETDPPQFEATLTGALEGDIVTLYWYRDAGLTDLADSAGATLTAGDELSQTVSITTGLWGNDEYWVVAVISRTGWTPGTSNTVTLTIDVPTWVTPADLFEVNGVLTYDGFWIDYSDPTVIFSDAGSTQITNGGRVYDLHDKSGNGYTFRQATLNDRPTWSNAGYGDLDTSGPADHLASTANIAGGAIPNEFTMFVLVNLDTMTDGAAFGGMRDASDTQPAFCPLILKGGSGDLGGRILNAAGTFMVNPSTTLETGFWTTGSKIIRGIVAKHGVGITPYINNVPQTTRTYNVSGTVSGMGTFSSGRTFPGSGSGIDGKLYQHFFTPRALSQTEIDWLVSWLGTK